MMGWLNREQGLIRKLELLWGRLIGEGAYWKGVGLNTVFTLCDIQMR